MVRIVGTCYYCGIETTIVNLPGTIRCQECYTITEAALEAIRTARLIGVSKYGPSSWCDISVQEHLNHAAIHLEDGIHKLMAPDYHPVDDKEDHLSHAICRLAMVKALQDG